MSSSQGVLFLRNENEEYKWFQDGDEDKDGKYVGEWRFGKGWNTTNYDKEGNTLGKYVNGKLIKN